MKNESTRHTESGVLFALAAYTTWGLFPLFWKLFQGVPHERVLAHRIVWSALFFLLLLFWRHGSAATLQVAAVMRSWRGLALSAALLGANWFIYIYAVNSGCVVESSFGYFITPLVNVLLGVVVLRERLRPLQWAALTIATVGVATLGFQGDRLPVIAISLAVSFGSYGLVRKKLALQPLAASTLESLMLSVPALAYFVLGSGTGLVAMAAPVSDTQALLLVLGGCLTGLPLLWFAQAAERLPLSVMGFFQYITPSLQLALAVFAYHEPFTAVHARSFACIWLGLLLCSVDAVKVFRHQAITC
ncbi:MAG: EamA family transporter RarD [Deltaproteobacteria bacterium]|nr:EamA family transporter RarD [Deltaproteobacteria bacterium]